jgi:hypothetical protein
LNFTDEGLSTRDYKDAFTDGTRIHERLFLDMALGRHRS